MILLPWKTCLEINIYLTTEENKLSPIKDFTGHILGPHSLKTVAVFVSSCSPSPLQRRINQALGSNEKARKEEQGELGFLGGYYEIAASMH